MWEREREREALDLIPNKEQTINGLTCNKQYIARLIFGPDRVKLLANDIIRVGSSVGVYIGSTGSNINSGQFNPDVNISINQSSYVSKVQKKVGIRWATQKDFLNPNRAGYSASAQDWNRTHALLIKELITGTMNMDTRVI